MYWISHKRVAIPYQKIMSSDTASQLSYVNHVWVLYNEEQNFCIVFDLASTSMFEETGSKVKVSEITDNQCDPDVLSSLIKE